MAFRKSGLGRGFDSLFAENSVDEGSGPVTVRLMEIEPNKEQPRKDFDEAALAELADSISKHGLLQPLLVRPLVSGGYSLVAGERRWRACKMAGLTTVPVVIREMDDTEAMELALIENLQREDLNPVEEALGYKYLMDKYSFTQEKVAETVTKSRSAVANALRLLNLSEDILKMLRDGEITEGHARAILGISDENKRLEAAQLAKNGASVREIEGIAKASKESKAQKTAKWGADSFYREIELLVKKQTGRKVKVKTTSAGKGTVTVEFFSDDDLKSIVNAISKKEL